MTSELFLQYIFAGLTYGIIYAIVAIGFNIIYNTTGIINFAQGEFVMLGGMIAISFNNLMPLPLAILLAVLITMVVARSAIGIKDDNHHHRPFDPDPRSSTAYLGGKCSLPALFPR